MPAIWSSWAWLLMIASTGNPTPPAAAMVTDGSMITVSEAPLISSEFPDGYAPFASPVSKEMESASCLMP